MVQTTCSPVCPSFPVALSSLSYTLPCFPLDQHHFGIPYSFLGRQRPSGFVPEPKRPRPHDIQITGDPTSFLIIRVSTLHLLQGTFSELHPPVSICFSLKQQHLWESCMFLRHRRALLPSVNLVSPEQDQERTGFDFVLKFEDLAKLDQSQTDPRVPRHVQLRLSVSIAGSCSSPTCERSALVFFSRLESFITFCPW